MKVKNKTVYPYPINSSVQINVNTLDVNDGYVLAGQTLDLSTSLSMKDILNSDDVQNGIYEGIIVFVVDQKELTTEESIEFWNGGPAVWQNPTLRASQFKNTFSVDIDQDYYEITSDIIDGYRINMNSTDDWQVVLPSLDNVPENYSITICAKTSDTVTGSILPVASQYIVNSSTSTKEMFGKSEVTVYKKETDSGFIWAVYSQSTFTDNVVTQGTQIENFVATSEYIWNHNLGYIPIVQIEVLDENGDYAETTGIKITHDEISKLSTTLEFNGTLTGRIIY